MASGQAHGIVAALVLAIGCGGTERHPPFDPPESSDVAPVAAPPSPGDAGPALSFRRVAVLGASVSAGFGGAPIAALLDEAIQGEHEVVSLADVFFFRDPFGKGADQVERALAAEPTAILALDFLFWFVYKTADLDWRMRGLERGLRLLEAVEVPLIVGDIPDMRTVQEWMLPASAVPPPEELEQFNQRIQAWSQGRPGVLVVPLSAWSRPLAKGGPVAPQPGAAEVDASTLVGPDGLHPNRAGVLYMLRLLELEIQRAFPATDPGALRF